LAQRLVGDGEQVLNVPATLAAPGVRVLPVGHGRKSDPDDAVSVAVAARSVLAVRRVRVEDQAVVLPLLTKRRVANMRVAVTPAEGSALCGPVIPQVAGERQG
jgi:transposase